MFLFFLFVFILFVFSECCFLNYFAPINMMNAISLSLHLCCDPKATFISFSYYHYSTADLATLFLAQFTSNLLQAMAQ